MTEAGLLRFASFRIDRRAGGAFRLEADGALVPITIGSRALDLLCVLAGRPGDLLSKREIMDAVWPDTTVEDKNLAMQVSALRQVLEREGGQAGWIQTVPGRGYRFVAPASEPDKRPPETPIERQPARSRRWPVASIALACAGAVVLIATGTGLRAGWRYWRDDDPVAYSPQDRRQSLIVLPFENASADPVQDDLAASLTREVSDLMAAGPEAPLVPPTTAAGYRGKVLDLREIGRAHDVHFALVGNAELHAGRIAATVTLYDTSVPRQVWSRRYDQLDGTDAKADIANRIGSEVAQATADAEAAYALHRHPDRLDKRDLMLVATTASPSPSSKVRVLARIALAERALAIDPGYVWALRVVARQHANLVLSGFSTDPERDIAVPADAIDRALRIAGTDYRVLRDKVAVLRAEGRWDEAAALTRRLIELQPRSAFRYANLGVILMVQGRHEDALQQLLTAKRLVTGADEGNTIEAYLALALLANSQYRQSIEQARFAMQQFSPESGRILEVPWLALIAAESASGEDAQARAELGRFLAAERNWRNMAQVQHFPVFAANDHLLRGLRQAGMPEQ